MKKKNPDFLYAVRICKNAPFHWVCGDCLQTKALRIRVKRKETNYTNFIDVLVYRQGWLMDEE